MNRLTTPLTLSCLLMLLTGCGDGEQKDSPVDGRDTDGLYEPSVENVSGRVIDGYLSKARIWLDLDGDYQYDEGSVDVRVGTNPERTVTFPGGEPTAMSGNAGSYTLDLSEFELDPAIAGSLDWRDYPLVVTVIPGKTEEETENGDVVLQHAYQMSAPPGVRYVSPLTTLVDSRRVLGLGVLDAGSELGQRLSGVNLTADYIRSGDEQAHAYARVMARFLADQFPDSMDAAVASSNGRVAAFTADARRIMRLSLSGNTVDIVRAVDDARPSGGQYSGIDTDQVMIPDVPLDLTNPLLLEKVVVRAPSQGNAADESVIDASTSNVAELTYRYSEEGILQSIEADGCMMPSMTEIARLAMVRGRVKDLRVQGLEGFFLNYAASRPYWDDDKINEKLVFDWENGNARFYSATGCHGSAPSSELGDTPQQIFEWNYTEQGQLVAVTSGDTAITPVNDTFAVDPFFSYTSEGLGDQALTLRGDPVECTDAISDANKDALRVVSAQQVYDYTDDATGMADPPVPPGGRVGGLKVDWDVRSGEPQLLRRLFFDAAIDATSLLQWDYGAEGADDSGDGVQSGLIREARLGQYSENNAWNCGGKHSRLVGSRLYGIVKYRYTRLSDYIEGRL